MFPRRKTRVIKWKKSINAWFAQGMAQNIIDVIKTAVLIGFVNNAWKNLNILWKKFRCFKQIKIEVKPNE